MSNVVTSNVNKSAAGDTTGEQVENRTLKFYCGTDWHDASQKCSNPCPTGQVSDCPDGERFFAYTSMSTEESNEPP